MEKNELGDYLGGSFIHFNPVPNYTGDWKPVVFSVAAHVKNREEKKETL